MGFFQNRVKVRVAIDSEYDVSNRIKMNVSAGVFSPMVVPKIMGLLSELPEGCAATKENGDIIILFDKIPQPEKVCSMCEIFDIRFSGSTDEVVVLSRFSDYAGVKREDYPEIENYSFNSNMSTKEQEYEKIMRDIAHSIFESDMIDERLQALKEKATELKNAHGEELKDAALQFLRNLRSSHSKESDE